MSQRILDESFSRLSIVGSNRHKIIVAVDYGTTFSGVAYVTTDKSGIDDINIITTWPGHQSTNWKTPTRLAYKRENSGLHCNKWGYDVEPKLTSYSWTKLLLDKSAPIGDYDDPALSDMSGRGMMKLPSFRNAQGVCEDFLREVYLYVSGKLRLQMTTATYDMTPMECWITLPAIWTEAAKDATLKAATRAGFGGRPIDEIYTIAEPEAAAIATLKRYSGQNTLNAVKPNEHVLICDCGGGTVDITTYTVTTVSPRLDFEELCVGVGGKCGSTYIDRNLHKLLSKRFGRAFQNLPHEKKGPGSAFMNCFEMVKRDFGLNDDRGVREISPLNLNIEDSQYYDEEERIVKLTYQDMQSLFEPVTSEIIGLVSQQVREVKQKKGAVIDRIILVGGFGESPYLNQVLKKWCLQNGNIRLMCPEHPQSAVVRGAALRGLEGIAPRMKQSRRHYGFSWSIPFREGIDDEQYGFMHDFSGRKYCRGRMNWVIAKGEPIVNGTSKTVDVTHSYAPGESVNCRLRLYQSALNDPQEHAEDPRVEKVGSILSTFAADFDFGDQRESKYNAQLGKTVYRMKFQVQVRFGDKGENLQFRTLFNGNIVSKAVIEFPSH